MKISMLVIGAILFFLGAYAGSKFFIAAGMIIIIMSFFGKVIKKKEKGKPPKQKKEMKSKGKCSSCGAETLSGDHYCPECGKKVLP